jgi:ribosomal protein L19
MHNFTPLDRWLNIQTWDSYHQGDEMRFHQAIVQLFIENGNKVELEAFRDYIIDKKSGTLTDERLHERAQAFAEKYDAIRSFKMDANLTFK